MADVNPRELYPVADIRYVMVEVGKLTANVDRLIEDVKSHGDALDRRAQDSAREVTKICDRLTPLETGLSGLLDQGRAPWWKRIDPANTVLAAIGIVTLLLTLLLGNGRFEDVSKRLDQAEKHADSVEVRTNRLEDHLGAKLDKIQADLATLNAERAVRPKQ